MRAPILLIDLGSVYWAAWHSSANDEVSAAHDRAVSQVRRLADGFELVAVCCDSPANFRKDLEPTYKANRPPRDSAAYEQLRLVKETLSRDGLLLWEALGFEADDVLATACRAAVASGHEVVVASSDKDLTQLVELGVTWLSPKTGERLGRDGVRAKFGVWPDQMRDYLAICGDSSDNVRGVSGVGPKGAAKLLAEYATIEQLMAAVQADPSKVATPKVAASIAEALAWLPTSIQLVTLRYDVPINWEQIYERREVRPLSNESLDMSEEEQETDSPEPSQDQVQDAPKQDRQLAPQSSEAQQQQLARIPPEQALVAPPSWDLGLEPTSLGAAYKLATGLYNSRLYSRFPSVEAIWAIIIRGREMGMGALTSLDSFHIVEGKPSPSAHLLIARAKSHPDCEYIEYVGGDETFAEWEGKTKRGKKPVTLRYTIDQAKRAGLLKSGGNWEKRPGEMLRKTCGVQLCRILVPGAMQGLYAAEELDAA